MQNQLRPGVALDTEGSKCTFFLPSLFLTISSISSSSKVLECCERNLLSNEISFLYLFFQQNIVNLAHWTQLKFYRILSSTLSSSIAYCFIFSLMPLILLIFSIALQYISKSLSSYSLICSFWVYVKFIFFINY